jgi:hypothetical protein
MASKKAPNPLVPETEFKDFVRAVIGKGDKPKPKPQPPKPERPKGTKEDA